jgi:hypothetical protein
MALSYTARLLPARSSRRYTWDTAPGGTHPPRPTADHGPPRTSTQTRSDDMAIGVGTLILIIILILILT